jgi:hypothetical protein
MISLDGTFGDFSGVGGLSLGGLKNGAAERLILISIIAGNADCN